MRKNRLELEWRFLAEEEQDTPWPPMPELPVSAARQAASPLRRTALFGLTMAFLLIAGIGGVYARQEAMKGVEQELHTAVQADRWVQQNANQVFAPFLVEEDASRYVTFMAAREQRLLARPGREGATVAGLNIEQVRHDGGVVVVELTLPGPAEEDGEAAVYRQTRIYRRTERGWLRIEPEPGLWGTQHTLETEHLIWRYRRRDHAAVYSIAERIDALYAHLQRDYGLVPSAGEYKVGEHNKRVIDVRPEAMPGRILIANTASEPIIVPSPALYLAPADVGDADILAQAVLFPLLADLSARAIAELGPDKTFNVLSGLRLWHLWKTELSLAQWRNDEVPVQLASVALDPGDPRPWLPARYRELCAAHAPWMVNPYAIGVPLYCDRVDSDVFFRKVVLAGLSEDRLPALVDAGRSYQAWITPLSRPIAMFTVVDYAVETYGRERLPELVAALQEHDSWQTLVPAVYGVPVDEFEEGWRQHVKGVGQ